jgi:hypothetical protein
MMNWHSIRPAALVVAAVLLSPLWSSGSSRADGQPSIVTDPDAVVQGHTLTQWTALYVQWAFASPASAVPVPGEPGQYYNATNDPTGAFAQALNLGPMFFVSGIGNPTTERTLNVAQGTAVLFPIVLFEDTEGPDGSKPPLIPPSIPGFKGTYAQEVDAVLDASSFSGIVLKVDGKEVKKLREEIVNDFSAGIVLPGSEGQVFFTGPSNPLPAGTVLYPSGTEGYYVILENLSPGEHIITTQYTFIGPYSGCPSPGCSSGHSEIINVIASP